MNGNALDDLVETKGEFAARLNVSAGRVSQYIANGQIGADALTGEGRNAKIRVGVAMQQLGRRLDVSHRIGNGLSTRLSAGEPDLLEDGGFPESTEDRRQVAQAPRAVTWEDKIQQEKLEDLQRKNRRAAMEEAAEAGRYTETSDVRVQLRRIAGDMMTFFEGILPEMASAIAAQFHVPQRDALHTLRASFRQGRQKRAVSLNDQKLELPQTVEVEPTEVQADEAA